MIITVSHISIDKITVEKVSYDYLVGGPVTYAGVALKSLGSEYDLYSVAGLDFKDLIIKEYKVRNLRYDLIQFVKEPTTRFHLIYGPDDERTLQLMARCRDIDLQKLFEITDVKYLLVSPICHEIKEEDIIKVSGECELIMLDVQGYFRQTSNEGYVIYKPWSKVFEVLSNIDYAKFAEAELECLAGCYTDEILVKILSKCIRLKALSVTRGGKGSVLAVKDDKYIHVYTSPTYNVPEVVDPTGAGDAFTATLFHFLTKGEDVSWSLAMANAMASTFVEVLGCPLTVSLEEIMYRADILIEEVERKTYTLI